MENVSLNEVEISAVLTDANIKNVQSGVDKLEIKTANKIPVLLGERDILKTTQLLPGIQTAGEENSYYTMMYSVAAGGTTNPLTNFTGGALGCFKAYGTSYKKITINEDHIYTK